jgi:predicted nucleotidyltransferase
LFKLFEEEKKLLNNITKDFIDKIKTIKEIESIVLFGSALTELKIGSDIDFLIVGRKKIDREAISTIETDLINKYGFHISATFMTEEELKEKAKNGEEFVINVMANGKLLYGRNLEDIVWSEK